MNFLDFILLQIRCASRGVRIRKRSGVNFQCHRNQIVKNNIDCNCLYKKEIKYETKSSWVRKFVRVWAPPPLTTLLKITTIKFWHLEQHRITCFYFPAGENQTLHDKFKKNDTNLGLISIVGCSTSYFIFPNCSAWGADLIIFNHRLAAAISATVIITGWLVKRWDTWNIQSNSNCMWEM